MHSRIPQPPSGRAFVILIGIAVVVFGVFAVVTDRWRADEGPVTLGTLSDEEARLLPSPPDLGGAPDLGPMIDWSLVDERVEYSGHVTVFWFHRTVGCAGCGLADGYMAQLRDRYRGTDLQVIDVYDIAARRFEREEFDWPALPDPDGAVAAAFVGTASVPAHYVAVVDRAGRVRYAAAEWPSYDGLEFIVAAVLVEDG